MSNYTLPRWIDGRKGLPVTLALMRELRDVAARIAELIHWFDAADLALDATLGDTLTRAELGFPLLHPRRRTKAMADLFGSPALGSQMSMFGDSDGRIPHPGQVSAEPSPERVRIKLHAILEAARLKAAT